MSIIAVVRPYSTRLRLRLRLRLRVAHQRVPNGCLARLVPKGALLALAVGSACAGGDSAWESTEDALGVEGRALGVAAQPLAFGSQAIAAGPRPADPSVEAPPADSPEKQKPAVKPLPEVDTPQAPQSAGGKGPPDPHCAECAFYVPAREGDASIAILFEGEILGASLVVLGAESRVSEFQDLIYLETVLRGDTQMHRFSTAGSIAATELNSRVVALRIEGLRSTQVEVLKKGGEGRKMARYATLLRVRDEPLPPVGDGLF